jgi:membrane protease YdiL (CAAX protease family)
MSLEAEELRAVAVPGPGDGTPPYGLVGLCLSLVAIVGIATALAAAGCATAALVEIVERGWSGFRSEVSTFVAERDEASTQLALVLASLLAYAAVTAAVLIMARWRAGAAWRSLIAWRPWRPDRTFWGLAALTIIYNIAVSALLSDVYPHSRDWVSVPHSAFGGVLFFLLAVVFAPITEEIVFRGWIYTSLKPRLGVVPGILVVSAVFAFLHYESSHLYALAVFPVGLALAYVRERGGSLKASISFHAVFNGFAFALAYLAIG